MKLFINACVRRDSRTRQLAEAVMAEDREAYREVYLPAISFPKVDEAFLEWRNDCVAQGDFTSPVFDLAKDFAAAEAIVVAAPFWDLSFPSMLKQYIEQICVLGITFFYNDQDMPQGLCRARKLTYVVTAGGPIYDEAFGYGYVKAVANTFFGIPETRIIKAENLDIRGADVDGIMRKAMEDVEWLVAGD
ncbi:MAG: NAD(P)H-dependent oxidoreductase [Eubacteriales bacterium]